MPAFQFKRYLRDRIVEGRKTQTLRVKLGPRIEVGARLTLMNGYKPGAVFGHATIVEVRQVAVAQLTDLDARRDGFANAAELRRLLEDDGAPPTLWLIRWTDFTPTTPTELRPVRSTFPTSRLTDGEVKDGWYMCEQRGCRPLMGGRRVLGNHAHRNEWETK